MKLQEMGVERFQAEGANTPLDTLVAYALEKPGVRDS